MKVLGIEPKGVQSVLFGPGHLDAALRFFHLFEGDGKVHGNVEVLKRARNIAFADRERLLVATFVFDNVAPEGVDDSTLKLYGLSNQHFRPKQLNFMAKPFFPPTSILPIDEKGTLKKAPERGLFIWQAS